MLHRAQKVLERRVTRDVPLGSPTLPKQTCIVDAATMPRALKLVASGRKATFWACFRPLEKSCLSVLRGAEAWCLRVGSSVSPVGHMDRSHSVVGPMARSPQTPSFTGSDADHRGVTLQQHVATPEDTEAAARYPQLGFQEPPKLQMQPMSKTLHCTRESPEYWMTKACLRKKMMTVASCSMRCHAQPGSVSR